MTASLKSLSNLTKIWYTAATMIFSEDNICMNLIDLSNSRRIGANSFYIEIGPFKLLVDAGIDPKENGFAAMPDFSLVEDYSLDYIILTHCHLDHLGALPVILRKQPQAQILASHASTILAPRMLKNSYNVMTKIKEELNVPEYPLYYPSEIEKLKEHFLPMPFSLKKEFIKNGSSINITFHPAGHIAGAVGVELQYKHRKIFFTGDVLFQDQLTLPGAKFPDGPFDTLILETTRGSTQRESLSNRETETNRLIETINHALSRGGSCLIPAFALGRMQELFAILEKARSDKKLSACPIYSSGLGMDLVDYLDSLSKKNFGPHFRRKTVHNLKVRPLPRKIRAGQDVPPGIYILSSGMVIPKTPSYYVAAAMLEHHHNSICFVGYCDPDTAGGKLLKAQQGDAFLFDDMDYVAPVRAHIHSFDLSGHADRDELLNYAQKVSPRAIVLTHGEESSRLWFDQELALLMPETKVIDPAPGVLYQV